MKSIHVIGREFSMTLGEYLKQIRGEKTIGQIAQKSGIDLSLIHIYKTSCLEKAGFHFIYH